MLPLPGFNARWHQTKKLPFKLRNKAITANGQNFRHTTYIDNTYISNTLHILTCTSMKEK